MFRKSQKQLIGSLVPVSCHKVSPQHTLSPSQPILPPNAVSRARSVSLSQHWDQSSNASSGVKPSLPDQEGLAPALDLLLVPPLPLWHGLSAARAAVLWL